MLDYDKATLYDLRADISRMLKEEAYRLGRPRYFWPEKGKEQDTGLYEPLAAVQKNQVKK